MGLLNLRYGYFAQSGAGTVVDDPTSAYNLKRRRKIMDFYEWFTNNMDTLGKSMTVDTVEYTNNFEIFSENSRHHHEKLLQISNLEDCRFSIVVCDLHVDLIRGDAFQHGGGRAAVTRLLCRSKKFEMQFFNIGDKQKPLTKNMLGSKRDSSMAHYLMDNANRSRMLLERWSNAA